MTNQQNIFTLIGITFSLAGCATSSNTLKPVNTYSQVVASGTKVVRTELGFKPTTRRDESIVYYLNNRNDSTNITAADVKNSFANYVCAGVSSLSNQLEALKFAQLYANTANSIATPASDDFAAQWAKYIELKKPVPELDPTGSSRSSTIRKKCFTEVLSLVPPKGVTATDISDEISVSGVFAAYEAATALVSSLKQLASRGLIIVNQKKAHERLKEFINKNDEVVRGVLGSDLRPDVISASWERRKARALFRPYYLFEEMLQTQMSNSETLRTAAIIETQLQEYDAFRSTTSPAKAIVAIAAAQDALKKAVNQPTYDKISLSQFLTSILEDLRAIEEDYDDIKNKAAAAKLALGAL